MISILQKCSNRNVDIFDLLMSPFSLESVWAITKGLNYTVKLFDTGTQSMLAQIDLTKTVNSSNDSVSPMLMKRNVLFKGSPLMFRILATKFYYVLL